MTNEERAHSYLEWFTFSHLPPHLQEVSKPFCTLASDLHVKFALAKNSVAMEHAMQRLLEAKDAAVRVALAHYKEQKQGSGGV